MTITRELVEQWVYELHAHMNLGMAPVFHTHKQVHDLCAIAAAHGAAERERELLDVSIEPVMEDEGEKVPQVKVLTESGGCTWKDTTWDDWETRLACNRRVDCRDKQLLYTATQLAAARLQGAEEERKKWEAEMVLHNNGVLRQRITDLEHVNQGLLEAAKRLVEHADFKLGGILSADSKAKDIPSNAVSSVKARHLASLRAAIAAAQEGK